ncbi:hypothetical protein LEMLEM_LOCUS6162 [Lemmus lemmus]
MLGGRRQSQEKPCSPAGDRCQMLDRALPGLSSWELTSGFPLQTGSREIKLEVRVQLAPVHPYESQ